MYFAHEKLRMIQGTRFVANRTAFKKYVSYVRCRTDAEYLVRALSALQSLAKNRLSLPQVYQ